MDVKFKIRSVHFRTSGLKELKELTKELIEALEGNKKHY